MQRHRFGVRAHSSTLGLAKEGDSSVSINDRKGYNEQEGWI